ncbi:MAG: hypothetical protein ACQEQN_06620 [Thermodesulfobacteriota bacterium]
MHGFFTNIQDDLRAAYAMSFDRKWPGWLGGILIAASGLKPYLGAQMFMPAILTWHVALPLFVAILLLWVLVAGWNEKTEKLIIF